MVNYSEVYGCMSAEMVVTYLEVARRFVLLKRHEFQSGIISYWSLVLRITPVTFSPYINWKLLISNFEIT